METTFGLPRYRFPPTEEIIEQIVAFCRDALESGAVDAIVASAPWDVKAEAQGMHVLLPIGNVLEIPQAGLATSDTKITRDADEIARLVRGIIRGTSYVRDPANRDEIAKPRCIRCVAPALATAPDQRNARPIIG